MKHAQDADKIKSAFLATMSHELRTPLNSIIGFTGIILQELPGPINEEQHKQLALVQKSARHLLSLINDVLDISKIEAGQMELSCTYFDLGATLDKVMGLVSPLAEKKEITLSMSIAPEIDRIYSDGRRLEQVVLNLLSNAVKFTEEGGVKLKCYLESNQCVISVSDTGIGMAEDEMENLFIPFSQIDTGLSRRYEGTGLGLSICKKIIELMGGTISVVSNVGHGSEFTIRFPIEKEESNEPNVADN
jgi:signal transduction histidine kinase